MATENREQSLNNGDIELVWIVRDGNHTIKLIESTDPEVTDPPTMVRVQTTRQTFEFTES